MALHGVALRCIALRCTAFSHAHVRGRRPRPPDLDARAPRQRSIERATPARLAGDRESCDARATRVTSIAPPRSEACVVRRPTPRSDPNARSSSSSSVMWSCINRRPPAPRLVPLVVSSVVVATRAPLSCVCVCSIVCSNPCVCCSILVCFYSILVWEFILSSCVWWWPAGSSCVFYRVFYPRVCLFYPRVC